MLIPAHIDLKNLRWQMILGLFAALLAVLACEIYCPSYFLECDAPCLPWLTTACSANAPFALTAAVSTGQAKAHVQNASKSSTVTSTSSGDLLSATSMVFDYRLWHDRFRGYLLINFLLKILCSALVALVVLEVTGLAGNRAGGAAAIWAGLLFSVAPSNPVNLYSIACRPELFFTMFLLATMYCALRFNLTKSPRYKVLALLSGLLSCSSLVTNLLSANAPLVKSWDFSETAGSSFILGTPLDQVDWSVSLSNLAYLLILVLFLLRLIFGTIFSRGLESLATLAILAAVLQFCVHAEIPFLSISFSAFTCVLLPLLALPVIDANSRKNLLLFNASGLICLVAVFLCYCADFEHAARSQAISITKRL
jgi:hypothetical protein